MTIWGIDYASARFDGSSLSKRTIDGHTIQFVARYLRNAGTLNKALTKAEADNLRPYLDIMSNEETTGSQYTGGKSGGQSSAAAAWKAHKAAGGPDDAAIYFSPWDHTTSGWTANDWNLLEAYLRGAAEEIGEERVGLYQGYHAVKWAFDNGLAKWGWQTYGWSTFKDKPDGQEYLHWEARAHVQQYHNGQWNDSVDFNRAVRSPFGSWKTGIGRVDELSDAEVQEIKDYIDEKLAANLAAVRKHTSDLYVLTARASDGRANLASMATDLVNVKAGVGALSDDEAKILMAMQGLSPGTLPDNTDDLSESELADAFEAAAANLRAPKEV
jgi:hypothetical protein